MRRPSPYRALLAAFLLVAMHQAAQWHALDHLGAWLQRPHEQALLVPGADGPCAICALFAAGASAAPGAAGSFVPTRAAPVAPAFAEPCLTTAAPSSYRIRAPPALL